MIPVPPNVFVDLAKHYAAVAAPWAAGDEGAVEYHLLAACATAPRALACYLSGRAGAGRDNALMAAAHLLAAVAVAG